MKEPSGKLKDLAYFLDRFGVSVLMCGFLCWILWHDLKDFKADVEWSLQRSIRNERAIMQKIGIPIILDSERNERNNK